MKTETSVVVEKYKDSIFSAAFNVCANAADAAAIKELVDHASRAEFIAQQAEDLVGQSMGIGQLNQYGSWNDATAAALNKCAGIKASEYNGQSTSGFNDLGQALGSSLSYKAADDDTVKGFKAILDGEMDAYPEAAFFNVGTIEDVVAKAKALEKQEA